MLGVQMERVFRGTQLGYIGSRITVSVRQYDLAMVQHRIKNQKMKDGEMILIAQPLLESRTCAYLEWLVNEIIVTANKTDSKNELLVMLSVK